MDVILLVVLGALLYMISAYLWRDTAVRRMRLRGAGPPPDSGDPHLQRVVGVLCGCAFEPDNRVDLLETGDELFARLLADVQAAEHVICWQVFWCKAGRLTDRVTEALAERARAGVEVLVVMDYFGAKGLPHEYLEGLRANGARVVVYRAPHWRSLYKVPHRSHVRSVVIDGSVGYTGGFGIDDSWLGDGRTPGQWRDTHVRLEGPAVDQLLAPFLANWAECTGEIVLGDGVMRAQAAASANVQAAAILYCSPSLGSTSAERFLGITISAASKSLLITSAYFVPSRGFRRLLAEAVGRGVDVRVLTAGASTDRPSARFAGRAHYEELLGAGVRIYEYAPTMLHAKTIVVDDVWTSVGSLNFDNRSLKLNDEVSLVVQDRAHGRAMREMFLRDLEHAEEVQLATFRRRPRRARTKELASTLVAPLL